MLKKFKQQPKIKQKRIIVFILFCLMLIISITLASVLISLGIGEYRTYVDIVKSTPSENVKDIKQNFEMFVYGMFFLVMIIIFLIASILYGNHTFNKKYYQENISN